ncbi:MAG: excinuclease ABC subunit UvrC [Bacteroidota bacterium]|jgi:excinuclease ABC subunit C|nr:excinuclease ABC subunit UvrC [Bacteroidota bacterium]
MSERAAPDILTLKLANLPKSPGVYQFKNADGKIIYVGKAKNLRSRVRSYFQDKGSSDPKREILVSKIADLELLVTDSEVEALLLENNLIKEHNPRYNVRLKDDKSYPYIVVTNEPFPRVFPTRQVRRDGSRYYGPYTDVKAMHLMLRTIRGIFPIRSCDYLINAESIARGSVRVCLDYHIRKCEGPCEGHVSQQRYREMIDQVEQLLKGKTRVLQELLEEEMRRCADRLEFERAAECRNRLQALHIYQDKQKVAASDFKDRDIIALARKDADAVGVVFRVRDGKIVGTQHFPFTGAEIERESEILEHIVHRYYSKTMDIPPEIVIAEELESREALEEWLQEKAQVRVSFTVPKIGDKAKLLGMCRANAVFILDEILLQKMKAGNTLPKSVEMLQTDLHLPHPPRRIECFDISHFQGAETVASMVSFLDGKPRKSEYRKFSIKTVDGVDDFASMREVIRRRYTRVREEGQPMPDLIVIDGGKGQLSSAVEVLHELDLATQPVIGLAKRLEEVFVPGESLPLNIAKTSAGLRLLQRVRDEAHRFAVTFHRERRSKSTLQTELEQIEGVGPKRAQLLLTAFGSVRAVREADTAALAAQIGWSAAKTVTAYFHPEEAALPSDDQETARSDSPDISASMEETGRTDTQKREGNENP